MDLFSTITTWSSQIRILGEIIKSGFVHIFNFLEKILRGGVEILERDWHSLQLSFSTDAFLLCYELILYLLVSGA